MSGKKKQVSAYVCADAPKAYLYIGYREESDPYPRVWLRTFDKNVAAMMDTSKLIEGPDFLDYDIGFCKSEESMDTLVAFIDTFTSQINRIGDTQLMKPTGEQRDDKATQ